MRYPSKGATTWRSDDETQALIGIARCMAAGRGGPRQGNGRRHRGNGGGRSIAQMQQDWRQFLAKGADIAESTAPLKKSEAEWKSSLPEQQFYVLRKEGTERPFTSPLNDEKRARPLRLRRLRTAAISRRR